VPNQKIKKEEAKWGREIYSQSGQLGIRMGDLKFIRISFILETIQPAFFLSI